MVGKKTSKKTATCKKVRSEAIQKYKRTFDPIHRPIFKKKYFSNIKINVKRLPTVLLGPPINIETEISHE